MEPLSLRLLFIGTAPLFHAVFLRTCVNEMVYCACEHLSTRAFYFRPPSFDLLFPISWLLQVVLCWVLNRILFPCSHMYLSATTIDSTGFSASTQYTLCRNIVQHTAQSFDSAPTRSTFHLQRNQFNQHR